MKKQTGIPYMIQEYRKATHNLMHLLTNVYNFRTGHHQGVPVLDVNFSELPE